MQGKVSIVMPCYNKEKYIGAMLDSIIAQEWNNIEVILVNDGSTDGTLGIINNYEPKLKNRGYTPVIIDKKNGGCCSAVKAGLDRVTGGYLSVIDADDELDQAYASTMAGWLEGHPEHDYCTCDYLAVLDPAAGKDMSGFKPRPWPKDSYTPEFFLFNSESKACWAFMTRMDYVRKCKLIENFYTETRGSYEPSFMVPLVAYGGRMKHFELPLYYYSSDAGGLSQDREFEKKVSYWKEYHRVIVIMLRRIPLEVMDPYKRKYFEALSSLYVLSLLTQVSEWVTGGGEVEERVKSDFAVYANNFLSLDPPLREDDVRKYPRMASKAAELALTGMWTDDPNPTGRVIGYGALGKSAAKYLTMLKDLAWDPTELWDADGDGVTVKKPDFGSLTSNDTVLVFPTAPSVKTEVGKELEKTGTKVFFTGDILIFAARGRFPQFGKITT